MAILSQPNGVRGVSRVTLANIGLSLLRKIITTTAQTKILSEISFPPRLAFVSHGNCHAQLACNNNNPIQGFFSTKKKNLIGFLQDPLFHPQLSLFAAIFPNDDLQGRIQQHWAVKTSAPSTLRTVLHFSCLVFQKANKGLYSTVNWISGDNS